MDDNNKLKVKIRAEWEKDPANPWLISYPRCGRNWLMMMVERITGKRTYHFTFPFSIEGAPRLFLSFHNMDYSFAPTTVIYLYRRDPLNVIYSWIPPDFQGSLEEETATKAREYGQHLDYYLYQKNYIEKKCVMVYEELEDNTVEEVCKLLNFLDEDYTLERVREVCSEMTKSQVGQNIAETGHGYMSSSPDYFDRREDFRELYGQSITNIILKSWPHLEEILV